MIRTLIAHTENIDDLEQAVADIKSQLDAGPGLLKNTVGIVSCHYEFAESGAAGAICKALPFETVGAITTAQATSDAEGTLLFSLFVITSDTLSFTSAVSPSLKSEPQKGITDTYNAAARGKKPSLIFAYAPFLLENSGDDYAAALSAASGGAPCFGTLAVDDHLDFSACYTFHNGDYFRDRLSMILVYGDIAPRFYLATISKGKLLDKSTEITSSHRHILKELNGKPALEYFVNLGLAKATATQYSMTALPFMVDYKDGTPPVSRAYISLDDNKNIICGGFMPQGASMNIGVYDKEDLLLTTGEAVKKALEENPKPSGFLSYSCIARGLTLGSDLFAEMELIKKEVNGRAPFMHAFSGGELCPTKVGAEKAVNRFHNNTYILCVF
jgi:hypothetical protein